jgi:hypothetical protein
MKNAAFLRSTALAWIALEVLRVAATFVIPAANAPGLAQMAWAAASDLIAVAAMACVAPHADWRGYRLGCALVAVPVLVALVNIVEGVYYLPDAHLDAPRLVAQAVIAFALAAPIWSRLFTPLATGTANFHPIGSRRAWGAIWRFMVSDIAYLVIYLAGGFAILPLVRDYYATRALPSPGVIFGLQLLLRGPLFVLASLLLIRMLGMPRWKGAAAVGAAFAVVSGVAPLMVPTPYIPDAIRWVHFFEVSITNFLFGALVAAMWGPSKRRLPAAST